MQAGRPGDHVVGDRQAQPFGVAAHTPPHMTTVRQDSMGESSRSEQLLSGLG